MPDSASALVRVRAGDDNLSLFLGLLGSYTGIDISSFKMYILKNDLTFGTMSR